MSSYCCQKPKCPRKEHPSDVSLTRVRVVSSARLVANETVSYKSHWITSQRKRAAPEAPGGSQCIRSNRSSRSSSSKVSRCGHLQRPPSLPLARGLPLVAPRQATARHTPSLALHTPWDKRKPFSPNLKVTFKYALILNHGWAFLQANSGFLFHHTKVGFHSCAQSAFWN